MTPHIRLRSLAAVIVISSTPVGFTRTSRLILSNGRKTVNNNTVSCGNSGNQEHYNFVNKYTFVNLKNKHGVLQRVVNVNDGATLAALKDLRLPVMRDAMMTHVVS